MLFFCVLIWLGEKIECIECKLYHMNEYYRKHRISQDSHLGLRVGTLECVRRILKNTISGDFSEFSSAFWILLCSNVVRFLEERGTGWKPETKCIRLYVWKNENGSKLSLADEFADTGSRCITIRTGKLCDAWYLYMGQNPFIEIGGRRLNLIPSGEENIENVMFELLENQLIKAITTCENGLPIPKTDLRL